MTRANRTKSENSLNFSAIPKKQTQIYKRKTLISFLRKIFITPPLKSPERKQEVQAFHTMSRSFSHGTKPLLIYLPKLKPLKKNSPVLCAVPIPRKTQKIPLNTMQTAHWALFRQARVPCLFP